MDQHYFNCLFNVWISSKDKYGFVRYFYLVTDDSTRHKTSRHVLFHTAHVGGPQDEEAQPGSRLLSDAATEGKTSDGNSNGSVEALEQNLCWETIAHMNGGTTDNASDATKEIVLTFDKCMTEVKTDNDLKGIANPYGFKQKAIRLGDPFHNANLVVTAASRAAFGDPKRNCPTQNHHLQLLESIHDAHSDDLIISRRAADKVMLRTGHNSN